MALDRAAALQAATWGMFQELGSNFQAVGFSTIDDFVAAMCVGEGRQMDIFVAHCTHFGLIQYLRSKDWMAFARGYNGSGQVNYYAAKLEGAYKAGKFPPVLPAPTSPIEVILRPGLERVFPGTTALDQDGLPIALTSEALISADPAIAIAGVSGPDDQQTYTISIKGLAVGQTTVSGPGVAWAVTVESSTVAQVIVDAGKAFTRRVPAAAAAMAALLMFMPVGHELPASSHGDAQVELAARTIASLPSLPSPLTTLEQRCLADSRQRAVEIERCLEWAHASLR
jgi:hypothetical protein